MPTLAEAICLAEVGRFTEAGHVALAAAEFMERRYPVSKMLYETYGAAGKFLQMAGEPRPAMGAFDRCLEVFDQVIVAQVNPDFVASHLNTWPELFTRAALAALDDDQPMRAIDYAEKGRARLAAHLTAEIPRPSAADEATWAEYVSAWRRLASSITNSRLKGMKPNQEERDQAASLRAIRRRLLDCGAEREALRPVSGTVSTEQFIKNLANADLPPTTLLYVISLDDKILRPVAVSRNGAFEVKLDESEQRTALTSAQTFYQAIVGEEKAALESAADAFIEAGGKSFAAMIRRALKGQKAGRLIWIPVGDLVTVPIAALPWGNDDGLLIDSYAIQVAPSMAMAARSLRYVRSKEPSAAYIEGRVDHKDAPTEGGETLLHAFATTTINQSRPQTIDELENVLHGADLALFSCHGVFHWHDPLTSYLKFGFDCGIEDLIGRHLFTPNSLAVLNTCDAGTVAQDVTNEPIGTPIAMMAGGAGTVVGPSQPIDSIAGVAFCLFFVKALGAGLPSPEAVQQAIKELRAIDIPTLARHLQAVGHPFASQIVIRNPGYPIFKKLAQWAFFQHWGGSWELEIDANSRLNNQ